MTGAPLIGGVAPAAIVVVAAKVTRVGMPRVILANGGIPVPVARGGGPVATGAMELELVETEMVVDAFGGTGVAAGFVEGAATGELAVVCAGGGVGGVGEDDCGEL